MRIESFWAKGFRSLRDVRLDGLGAFNVFYGPNGSGKSNLLAAMDAWIETIAHARMTAAGGIVVCSYDDMRDRFRVRDFALGSARREAVLGGTLVGSDRRAITVELVLTDRSDVTPGQFHVTTPANEVDLFTLNWRRDFSLVPADRMPRTEVAGERPPEGEDPLSWYFRHGRIKEALFAAHNSSSPAVARSLDRFRQLMAGPPLNRPPFRSVEDPYTGARDLHERLPPPLDDQEVSLDLAGLGIAQIYWIIGQAMLSGARMIGVEEPEAHLHAPTTGRHLREVLQRLVDEKHVDQTFIATHSNLFDLDPKGYWDVSLQNGETVVTRADLPDIDRKHLYEPGPAKHGLQRMLEYMPGDEVVFRRADGSPITAAEMLRMLQEGTDDAVRFLEDLHGAALRMVRVAAKKKAE
jgi:energy-coupling factor transporter ATP-binding protein EcfA2